MYTMLAFVVTAALSVSLAQADASDAFITESELRIPLSPDGTLLLPDLADRFEYAPGLAVTQIPAPDELFTGTQTVTVNLLATDGATDETKQVQVDLIDSTPPTLHIVVTPENKQELSPGGFLQFIAPVSVLPLVSVTDTCDPDPATELYLNGSPYSQGTPVTALGLHSLHIVAEDESGNQRSGTVLFEIRKRPNHRATVEVERFDLEDHADGTAILEATLLLASEHFNVKDISLPTLNLWLADDSFKWISHHPVTLERIPEEDTYNTAYYRDCHWRLDYHALIEGGVSQAPDFIQLTGVGDASGAGAFDFMATAEAAVAPDPLSRLASASLLCNDFIPPIPPPPIPPPPTECEWVHQWVLQGSQPISQGNMEHYWDGCWWSLELLATPASIIGEGLASDVGCVGYSNVHGGASTAASGAVLNVFLTPVGCCESCQITVTANPRFQAEVAINPPASATAAGRIAVSSLCGDAVAVGGVAAGYDTEYVEVFDIVIPVQSGDPPAATTKSAELACPYNGCVMNVVVATSVDIAVWADESLFGINGASAHSKIFGSQVALSVQPTCLSGEAEPTEPIVVSTQP